MLVSKILPKALIACLLFGILSIYAHVHYSWRCVSIDVFSGDTMSYRTFGGVTYNKTVSKTPLSLLVDRLQLRPNTSRWLRVEASSGADGLINCSGSNVKAGFVLLSRYVNDNKPNDIEARELLHDVQSYFTSHSPNESDDFSNFIGELLANRLTALEGRPSVGAEPPTPKP